MQVYRLLWRDENGNLPKSTPIECSTVQHAIGIAEQQTGNYAEIEIWDGTGPVARVDNPNRVSKPAGAGSRRRYAVHVSS